VYVEGRLQTRSWEDQTGTKKYRTEIVAENIIMLDRAGSAQPGPVAEKASAAPAAAPEEEEINVEDIPF
jgi:single-strand DNA-binding protein